MNVAMRSSQARLSILSLLVRKTEIGTSYFSDESSEESEDELVD